MKTYQKHLRTLGKVLPLLLLVFLVGFSSLHAEKPLNPYAEEDNVVMLDDSFMFQIRIFVAAIGLIFLLGIFVVIGALTKNPQKLTLMSMLNSIKGKNYADPEMHHEYDGIRELDNPIPGYLQVILYGTILFGVVYLFHYHVLGTGALQEEEYEIEMAEAALKYKDVELPESAIIMITDAKRLDKAATLFTENCATCHGKNLEGDSGPNLTDPYWLHGGKITNVYTTISEGVTGKTMIGWKKKLSSQQRLELASYVMSKQGSNPANAKEPEGTIDSGDEGDGAVIDSSATDTTGAATTETDTTGANSAPVEGDTSTTDTTN